MKPFKGLLIIAIAFMQMTACVPKDAVVVVIDYTFKNDTEVPIVLHNVIGRSAQEVKTYFIYPQKYLEISNVKYTVNGKDPNPLFLTPWRTEYNFDDKKLYGYLEVVYDNEYSVYHFKDVIPEELINEKGIDYYSDRNLWNADAYNYVLEKNTTTERHYTAQYFFTTEDLEFAIEK